MGQIALQPCGGTGWYNTQQAGTVCVFTEVTSTPSVVLNTIITFRYLWYRNCVSTVPEIIFRGCVYMIWFNADIHLMFFLDWLFMCTCMAILIRIVKNWDAPFK